MSKPDLHNYLLILELFVDISRATEIIEVLVEEVDSTTGVSAQLVRLGMI